MNYLRKFVSSCLLNLMLLALVGNSPNVGSGMKQAGGGSTVPSDFSNYYVTEIENASIYSPYTCTSHQGTIYIESYPDLKIYNSSDGGNTWTNMGFDGTSQGETLYVDADENLWFTHGSELKKWDLEAGWTTDLSMDGGRFLYVAENLDTGSFYATNYTTSGSRPYGDSVLARKKNGVWTWVFNYSDYDSGWDSNKGVQGQGLHVDTVNHWVWLCTDGVANQPFKVIWYSKDDGNTWNVLVNSSRIWKNKDEGRWLDLWNDDEWLYIGGDGGNSWRIPIGSEDWSQAEQNWCYSHNRGWEEIANQWVIQGHYYPETGLYLFTTTEGKVYASGDGAQWISVYDGGESANDIWGLSTEYPIYFCTLGDGKLFRLDFPQTGDEARSLTDIVTSSETMVSKTIIVGNGSSTILNLGQTVVKNPTITFVGRNYRNYFENSGFETGDTNGWSFDREVTRSITSSEEYEGTYCINATMGTLFTIWQEFEIGSSPNVNRTWVFSLYIKSKLPIKNQALRTALCYKNSTSGWTSLGCLYYNSGEINATWRRIVHFFERLPNWATRLKPLVYIFQNSSQYYLLDAFQLEHYDYGHNIPYHSQNINSMQATDYFTTIKQTTNPSVSIGGQRFSYAGTLNDNEEQGVGTYNGYLVGGLKVGASISGSKQVDVKISGTKVMSVSSVYLRQKTGDLYVGKYFGTPSFSYNAENKLILLLDGGLGNITYASLSRNSLRFTLTSYYTGHTRSIKLYTGNKGKPIAIYIVNGTLDWSFNASTAILTLNVAHENSTSIIIYWKFPGDVNDDGIVDVYDLAGISEAYGATPRSSNWDESCDTNGDEIIDSHDLQICRENYGKSQPQ